MMKIKNLVILCIFSLASVIVTAQSIPTLRIDPSNARSGTISQIFEDIKYTPLETTKESLFGTIGRLTVTAEYFIIFDPSTKSILFFDKNGKYHAKINDKKLTINGFLYEKNKGRIKVYLVNEKAMTPEIQAKAGKNPLDFLKLFKKLVSARYYDLDGKPLNDVVADGEISISSVNYTPLSEGIMASNFCWADAKFPDSTAYQLNIYKNGQLHKSYFPYNTKKDIVMAGGIGGSNGLYKSQNDSIIYFTRPFDYSIYKVTPDSIDTLYKFIFPIRNTVPHSFLKDSISTVLEFRKYMRANPSFITGLDKIHIIDDFLLFQIKNNEINFDASNGFIYNLKSGDLVSISKSTPDKQNSYLPFLGNSFSYEGFLTEDNKYLFTQVSSLEMFQAQENNTGKNPLYAPVLENYFKTENRKSNPVIVQLKLKENL